MPRIVVLDWDDHELRLVLATQHGHDVTIEEARVIAIPSDKTSDAPAADLQSLLSTAIGDTRYGSSDAFATIRRAEVELRLLKLPPVPDEELPDIVRFQSLREFSELSEDWPIDFYRVGAASDDEVTVLAAAVSPARLNKIRSSIENADLKLRSLVLRPCAAASLIPQTVGDDSTVTLMVDDFGSLVELTVLRGDTTTFFRTVQLPAAGAQNRVQQLAGEIRRTMVAARNQMASDDVSQVVYFSSGAEHDQICGEIQQKLNLPVTAIHPFDGFRLSKELSRSLPENSSRFAAALGLLKRDDEAKRHLIDFLNPRKVEAPKSQRNLWVGIASAAAILLLAGGGLFWWRLYALDSQLKQKMRERQNLAMEVEKARASIEELTAIKQWQQGAVNWLDLMQEISADLPDAERALVRDWRANVAANGNGVLVLEGVVDEHGTIAQLEGSLRSDKRSVRGQGGDFENRLEEFPWQFKETVTINTGNTPSDSTPPPGQTQPRTTFDSTTRRRAIDR